MALHNHPRIINGRLEDSQKFHGKNILFYALPQCVISEHTALDKVEAFQLIYL